MSNLRKQSSHALLWNGLGQYTVQVLSFGTAAVLGRVLDPTDFGIVGMILAVNAFLILFANVGLASTIVQHSTLDRSDLAALWGGGLFLGLCVSCVMAAASPAIAWFFKEPKLLLVSVAAAPCLFLTAINNVPVGVLQRDFKFKAIAANNVIAAVLAASVAIFCAFRGLGYWALIIQMAMRSCLVLALNIMASKIILMPQWDVSLYRRLIGFTGNLSLFQVINYFHRNLDSLLVGRIMGAASLGFYTRSSLLLRTFNTAFGGVIAPVLHSALAKRKNDVDAMRRGYSEVLRVILWISAPLMGVLAGLAPVVIRVVWGEGWDLAVTPFFWLALAAMHQSVFATIGTVFMARNRTRALLISGCLTTLAFGGAMASGLVYGLDGIARHYSIMSHLVFLPVIAYVWRRLLNGSLKQLLGILTMPTIFGWIGAFLCFRAFAMYSLVGSFSLISVPAFSIYLWGGFVLFFSVKNLFPALRSFLAK